MASTPPLDSPAPDSGLSELSRGELLAEASEASAMLRELEVYRLRVAYQWAVAHPLVDAAETPDGAVLPAVLSEPDTLGGPGTPPVAAFTAEALSVATACSPGSAAALMADALDLAHRLPLLWDHVQAGLVPVWKARRVADRTRHLSFEAAGWIDRQVASRVSSVGPARLDRLVAEAAARCDGEGLADRERRAREGWDVVLSHPTQVAGTSRLVATGDTLDLTRFHDVVCAEAETMAALGDTDSLGTRKARALGVIADQQARLDLTTLIGADSPTDRASVREVALDRRTSKTKLYLHASLTDLLGLTTGDTGTVEALGPATLELIKAWVGRTRVSIQPVLHVAAEDRWSVDRHDPPPRMADQVRLRDEVCVFPWCSRPARACDLDHLEPYQPATSNNAGSPEVDPGRWQSPGDSQVPQTTTPENLAPLCRQHHRAKTTGRWRYERLDPGQYLWHGPAGASAMVTPRGTVALPLN